MAEALPAYHGRPIEGTKLTPLWPNDQFHSVTVDSSVTEREVIWRMLTAPAEVQSAAQLIFTTKRDLARFWPDFRNYIRLAKVYDDTAEDVPHVARALVQYYCALQLAKAELLVHNPDVVFNQRIAHGLSFQPERAKSFRGDILRVGDGVFRELHAVRTGERLPVGTSLKVIDLLRACPDVEYEFGAVVGSQSTTAPVAHYVAHDSQDAWSLVAVGARSSISACRSSTKALGTTYRRCSPLAPKVGYDGGQIYESRWSTPLDVPGGGLTPRDLQAVTVQAMQTWRSFVGVPIYGSFYAAPSHQRSTYLPLRPDLARYAAIYYLSSIVRYKPSRLEDSGRSEAGWLLNAFSQEAGLHVVRSALAGITGDLRIFHPPAPRQTGVTY